MKLIEKAYKINRHCLPSKYWDIDFEDEIFYGTRNQAKYKAFEYLDYNCISTEDKRFYCFNYSSVKVSRCSEYDLYEFRGERLTNSRIKEILAREERNASFQKMIEDNSTGYAYIMKGGYYYRPDSCGYTEFKIWAGVYTIQEAAHICKGSSTNEFMRPIPIDIKEHNEMINKEIKDLKNRLISYIPDRTSVISDGIITI